MACLYGVAFILSLLSSLMGIPSIKKRFQAKYPRITDKYINGYSVRACFAVALITFFLYLNDQKEKFENEAKIIDLNSRLSTSSIGSVIQKELIHGSMVDGNRYVTRFSLNSKEEIPVVHLKVYGKTITSGTVISKHGGGQSNGNSGEPGQYWSISIGRFLGKD